MTVVEAPPRDERDVTAATGTSAPRLSTDTSTISSPAGTTPFAKFRPRPSYPPPPPRRHRSVLVLLGLAVLLVILLVAVVLGVSVSTHSSSSSSVPSALQTGGTVISAHTTPAQHLVVRTSGADIVHLSMAGKQLVSGDGHALALTSVRPGDAVRLRTPAQVLDKSQMHTSVQGIVAISPDLDGDVMSLQLSPTRTLLVDISGKTGINGRLPSVPSLMSIRVASQVRVEGILDKTLDEVTQTWSIRVLDKRGAP